MKYAYRSRLIFLALTCATLLCCWSIAAGDAPAKETEQAARLGRAFKLRAWDHVTLPRERLRIKFASVKEDSRCPADVKCVWAGNAAVRLEVSIPGKGSKTLTLNINNSSSSVDENQYGGYKLKLVELSPYPRSDRKIRPGDYVATLLVSKD